MAFSPLVLPSAMRILTPLTWTLLIFILLLYASLAHGLRIGKMTGVEKASVHDHHSQEDQMTNDRNYSIHDMLDDMFDVMEEQEHRINQLENSRFGSSFRGEPGFSSRNRMGRSGYRSNQHFEPRGNQYDDDYQQGSPRGPSRWEYETEGRGGREALNESGLNRIAMLRTLNRRNRGGMDAGRVTEDEDVPTTQEGTPDLRTREGREAAINPDEYSDEDLIEMMSEAPRNKDNSIDLRSQQGRILQACGVIDEDGWPVNGEGEDTPEVENTRGGRTASSTGRGRGRPKMHQGGK